MLFQVDENGYLAAFMIRNKLDTSHSLFSHTRHPAVLLLSIGRPDHRSQGYLQVSVNLRREPFVHPLPSAGKWVKYT
jgi:hypothetical protein